MEEGGGTTRGRSAAGEGGDRVVLLGKGEADGRGAEGAPPRRWGGM